MYEPPRYYEPRVYYEAPPVVYAPRVCCGHRPHDYGATTITGAMGATVATGVMMGVAPVDALRDPANRDLVRVLG